MNIYGPIVTAHQVELAAVETLKTWETAYRAELTRQHSITLADLPPVLTWETAAEIDAWPEWQKPAVVVVCPGLSGDPVRHSGGYRTMWELHVATVAAASDRDATRRLVSLYTAAWRAVIAQHQSLGGLCESAVWIDERFDQALDNTDSRSIGVGVTTFEVHVAAAVDPLSGPAVVPTPPETDPGQGGVVLTHSETTNLVEEIT